MSDDIKTITEFLSYLMQSIVDHPEEVRVAHRIDEMGTLLSVDVHPNDMGQVIGRQAETIKAIRSLVRIVGVKHHARVSVFLKEPEGGKFEKKEGREINGRI